MSNNSKFRKFSRKNINNSIIIFFMIITHTEASHIGEWKRGTPDTHQEGAAPAGVTVLVPDEPIGISPDPRKKPPP
jgi:hypothetical protein